VDRSVLFLTALGRSHKKAGEAATVKVKYIIGSAIIVVFIVWGAMAFLKTSVRYVSLEEAGESRHTVQVLGAVDFDRVRYDTKNERLEFAIYDAESGDRVTAHRLPVVYYGVVPGNFEQADKVVLKGKMGDEGMFVVDQMFVKCPSKYQGEADTGYQDVRKHNPSGG
jgi:cytochrome c-type biogenesis protein CcmE